MAHTPESIGFTESEQPAGAIDVPAMAAYSLHEQALIRCGIPAEQRIPGDFNFVEDPREEYAGTYYAIPRLIRIPNDCPELEPDNLYEFDPETGVAISEYAEFEDNTPFSFGPRSIIHPYACIHEGVVGEANVTVGHKSEIGRRVYLGSNVKLADSVVLSDEVNIGRDASLGSDVRLGRGASIGFRTTVGPKAIIEDGVAISQYADIGRDVFLDHDVVVGDKVKIEENATLKGGSLVRDEAVIGSYAYLDAADIGAETVVHHDAKIIKAQLGARSVVMANAVVGKQKGRRIKKLPERTYVVAPQFSKAVKG